MRGSWKETGDTSNKIEYVVGFFYNKTKSSVVLIEKQRPAWQRKQLNGVGGHIKLDEVPHDAMRREFREEAGLEVDDWELAVVMTDLMWRVYFFIACGCVRDVYTRTDENLQIVSLHHEWPRNILPNLRWLIPLCLDSTIIKPTVMKAILKGAD